MSVLRNRFHYKKNHKKNNHNVLKTEMKPPVKKSVEELIQELKILKNQRNVLKHQYDSLSSQSGSFVFYYF